MIVDTTKCVFCLLCVDECPHEAIIETNIITIDNSKCKDCGECRRICPSDAIENS
jgi:pyruvate formate lyase activating enzyme